MGQIFDRSNRARLTQKNAEDLILQNTSPAYSAFSFGQDCTID
jgi:hypothetical protein